MSVNFGDFKALLTPPDVDEKLDPAARGEGGAFAGRLTRAIVPSPVPNGAAVASLGTKGVPLVDVMALEALPLQPAHVACAPRFWEAAELVTHRSGDDDDGGAPIEGAQDALSRQSFGDRREQQTLYPPETALALAAQPRPLPKPQIASSVATPPPSSRAKEAVPAKATQTRHEAKQTAVGSPAKTDVTTQRTAAADKPPMSIALTASAALAAAAKTAIARMAAPGGATPVAAREHAGSARSGAHVMAENLSSPAGAPPPPATVAPSAIPSTPNVAEPLKPQLAPTSRPHDELPLAQVQWRKGEARVSVQTDAGALSLHVRVKDGVADVAATGPAAMHLDGRAKELTAQLAKEGLRLGRFAAVDVHAAAMLMSGSVEDEAEAGPCQELDEDDGTASADAGDKRRVFGERQRLRPSRRVHVKA